MRNSPGPLLRRATVGVLAPGVFCARARAAAPPAPEAPRLPFAERYHALQHGGIVRAAGTAVSTRSYVDVDSNPDTYNSSRAEVRPPDGARVTYARLYRGGNPTLWDGFGTLDARFGQEARPRGVRVPKGASGRAALVSHGGDRGRRADSLTVSTGRGPNTVLTDAANPRDGVLNSTISAPRTPPSRREPSCSNTLGYGSDVFDLGTALRRGGDQPAFRLVSQRDAAWAGVLFRAVDATE